VFRGLGDGTFASPERFTTGHELWCIALGDFDGDGVSDVVSVTGAKVAVFRTKAGGKIWKEEVFVAGARPTDVAVGDLNGDGSPDLLTANPGSATVGVRLYGQLTTPVLRRISPATGGDGTVVTLTGMHFGTKRGRSTVSFGDVVASAYVRWSDTSLRVRVPAGTAGGDVLVQVKTRVGTSAARHFLRR
jgi:hypothetical protein